MNFKLNFPLQSSPKANDILLRFYNKSTSLFVTYLFTFILDLMISIFCYSAVSKAESLEDVVRKMQSEGSRGAVNGNSKNIVPSYSENGKNAENQRLNSLSDSRLQEEGRRVMRDSEQKDDIAGITSKASKKPLLENYDNLKMFTKADKIYFDPVSAFNEFSKESCKESLNNKKLEIGTIEEVETIWDMNYEKKQCEVPKNTFACQKTLHLTCEVKGLEKENVATGLRLDFTDEILTIGSEVDNDWDANGHCKIFDLSTSIMLRNITEIEEFRLIDLGFDDYLLLSINDHIVYVGPDGGNKLEIVGRNLVNNGHGNNACERGSDRHYKQNIDLIPYLKEGKNEIFMRLVVGGKGEVWIKIKASRYCASWKEEWREECTY